MHNLISFAQYFGIAAIIGLPACAVGLGQGLAGKTCMASIDRQPAAYADLRKTLFIGMALNETTAIMSLLIGLMLLGTKVMNPLAGPAIVGIVIAITVPAIVAGIGSAFPVNQSLAAITRQPTHGKKIASIMLITLSFLQTPIIFGFIIALLIYNALAGITSPAESTRLCASGMAIGIGSIGPEIGMSIFAQRACASLGINPTAYSKIMPFTFINQALIETPILFAFSVALALLIIPTSGACAIAAALAIGLSTLGTGISTGRIAVTACKEITKTPEISADISRVSVLAQALIDTSAIYGLIIAIMLLL